MLVDEVAEEGEYHDEALEAAQADYLSEGIGNLKIEATDAVQDEEKDVVVTWAQEILSKTAYVQGCRERVKRLGLLTRQGTTF